MKRTCQLLMFGVVLVLSGCFVPEKFAATIRVNPDASYVFTYKGTVAHALAAIQVHKTGHLSSRDEAAMQKGVIQIKKDRDVKSVSYMGKGRYALEIETHKSAGQILRAFDVFSVSTDKDGRIAITSAEIKKNARHNLASMGIKIDGRLEVHLPRNAEVLSHNATSTPYFFGLFGNYAWKIGSIEQRPAMLVRLKR